MESVGSHLRSARLRLGFTLEQINAKTRISLRNLEAIENDRLDAISSPFFYKSYVKQIAAHLELHYPQLEETVQRAAATIPEPLMPGQETMLPPQSRPPKLLLSQVKRPLNLRWLYSAASFVLMLIACSSFYGVWQQSRSDWRQSLRALIDFAIPSPHAAQETIGSTAAQLTPGLPQVSKQASITEPATPPSAAAATGSGEVSKSRAEIQSESAQAKPETQATIADAAFRAQLSVSEPTWLSVVTDGRETFSGTLQPGETKIVEGRETGRVRTGNAGGLNLVFNGKPLASLGPRGQIRTVVFTKDNYEVLGTPQAEMAHVSPIAE